MSQQLLIQFGVHQGQTHALSADQIDLLTPNPTGIFKRKDWAIDFGFKDYHGAITGGFTVVIPETEGLTGPDDVYKVIRKHMGIPEPVKTVKLSVAQLKFTQGWLNQDVQCTLNMFGEWGFVEGLDEEWLDLVQQVHPELYARIQKMQADYKESHQ